MLVTAFGNYLILLCIFGYSFLVKRFLIEGKNKFTIINLDFFYGLLFIIFLSLSLNFFFPLRYFTLPVIFIGFIAFILAQKNKTYKINFVLYFLILFLISAVAFYGRNNIDSPMYHLQIVNWITLHKINFGISNLGIRLGFNSSWHSFLALLNLTYETYSAKYYLSAVIFAFAFYEAAKNKLSKDISCIFIYLFICYLFLFSYLHPVYYGIILNHIGNPERDIASMFLYFSSFYIFIKIFEANEPDKKINLINLLLVTTFICVTARLTTLLIISLPLFVILKSRDYKILINPNSIFIFIIGFLWLLRSFILSGCLVFPVIQTCFSTEWSVNLETLAYMVDEAKRYTRTLPYLNGLGNYDYTLNTYDWVKPWIKDYLFTTALLQINLFIILSVTFFLFVKQFFVKFFNINSLIIESYQVFILVILFLSVILWMVTPEIRYAWGLHFVIPCFFLTVFIKNNLYEKLKKINQKIYFYNLFLIFIIFLSKNISVFKVDDLISIPYRNHDFSKIKKIGTFNEIDIFFNFWKCADFKDVCVNIPRDNYDIVKKYSYVFYKKD